MPISNPINLLRFSIYTFVLCACFAGGSHAATQQSVIIGMSPWTHQDILFKWARPVISYMENASAMKIRLASAQDLGQYFEKAKSYKFDLMISPMHLGLHLIKHHNYTPLVLMHTGTQIVMVGNVDAGVHSLNDLQGKSVLVPLDISIGRLMAKHELSVRGIQANLVEHKDHWKVIEGLRRGKGAAGVFMRNLYLMKDEAFRKKNVIIYENPVVLNGFLLKAPNGPDASKIVDALVQFHTDDPRALLKSAERITPELMADLYDKLAPYLKLLEQEVLPARVSQNP